MVFDEVVVEVAGTVECGRVIEVVPLALTLPWVTGEPPPLRSRTTATATAKTAKTAKTAITAIQRPV